MATSFFLYFLWSGRGSISSNSSYAVSRQLWEVQVLGYIDRTPGFLCQYLSALFPLKKQLFYLSTSYQLTMYHPPTQAAILGVKGWFRCYLPSRADALKTGSSAL